MFQQSSEKTAIKYLDEKLEKNKLGFSAEWYATTGIMWSEKSAGVQQKKMNEKTRTIGDHTQILICKYVMINDNIVLYYNDNWLNSLRERKLHIESVFITKLVSKDFYIHKYTDYFT